MKSTRLPFRAFGQMPHTSQPEGANHLLYIFSFLLLLAVIGATPATLEAQTVSFANSVTTLGERFRVTDIAGDAAGNVYLAAEGVTSITKIAPDGSQTSIGSGLGGPWGVAADASGNVYISEKSRGQVMRVTPAGDQAPFVTGLASPTHLTFDAAGNLYIADTGHNRILKVTPAGDQSTVGADLDQPQGVASDPLGNVYIGDTGNNRMVRVAPDGTQSALNVSVPYDVAIDKAGNIVVAQPTFDTVLKIAPDGSRSTVPSGASSPYGVGLDDAGNVLVADRATDRFYLVQVGTVRFRGANVCPSGQSSPAPCSQTLTLNYDVTIGGSLGTPAVLTQGSPYLDFQLAEGSTCVGVVTGGSSCTVKVTFAPLGFGQRLGAVQLTDSSGKILTTTYLSGIGLGPIVGFNEGTPSVVPDLRYLEGLAVDAAGNLFTTQTVPKAVLKISPSGTRTQIASVNDPSGVAVDGAGNVYVSDYNTGIQRIAPDGTQTLFSTIYGFHLAFDTAGNLFVADFTNSRVAKIAPDGAVTTVISGLNYVYGVAVDHLNNVYVSEANAHRVLKVPPVGAPTTLVSDLQRPLGLAVDQAGNVYVVDLQGRRALRVAPDGSQRTITTDLSAPRSVAVDGFGNVLIGDFTFSRVLKFNRSQPPSLTFGSAVTGSPSSDSPQSVTVQNFGNRTLSAAPPGLAIATNFQQVPGPGTPADCTSAFSLAPGASCNLSISFVPQTGGAIQGSAVLTDNALNVSGATQTILLSGPGILKTATNVTAATGQYSDKVTLSAQIGPSGQTFDGTLQFKVDGVDACSATVAESGNASCVYTAPQAAGTYSIVATLTSTAATVQGSTGSGTLTVTREDATITPSGNNAATVQVNAAGGTAGPITLQAVIQQAADGSLGDLAKAVVTVTLTPTIAGASTITCPATNNNGALTATCSNIPVDAYTVRWNVSGNYYQGPQANSVLAIFDPSLGFVTGSGSVRNNGVAADFAISVKYLANGALSGGITYVEHRSSGDVSVSSLSLSSMSLVGASAVIQGQASVNGSAGYTFQLVVADNGSPGVNRDTLGLQVNGGMLNPPISFSPSAITAGNIQTH